MFDFAWSEIALIGVVALIAIGPKDMPGAIRTVSTMIKKARRMAAEFQTHVDEMVREADLGDVKKAFTDIRSMDLPSLLEKHVDPDRTIRNTFSDNPLEPSYPTPLEVSTLDEVAVNAQPVTEIEAPAEAAPVAAVAHAPAWVPPAMIPPPQVQAVVAPSEPPSFIPPEAALQRQSDA
jgi:sec-independent protein translocase protein TatB